MVSQQRIRIVFLISSKLNDCAEWSKHAERISKLAERISKLAERISNFSVRSYLPLIRKDSSTYVYALAVYVNEGLPFARTYM